MTSTNEPMGRLERVDLREAWGTEDGDFTPWLAQEANIALLGDAIGMELVTLEQEKQVGPFRADILCLDTATENHLIVIENQLNCTDHRHLGQLMTYASGLKCRTIIWIADQFTNEHRSALDWLNEITDEEIRFFGIEMELWRIGDSPLAPKFNIVSNPNDWTKASSGARHQITSTLSETEQLQIKYWKKLNELMLQGTIKPRKPRPQHWMTFSLGIGYSQFRLHANFTVSKNLVTAGLMIQGENAKAHFALLLEDSEEIEKELGEILVWDEKPKAKYCIISFVKTVSDIKNLDVWQSLLEWQYDKLVDIQNVFAPRIKTLDASDYIPDETDLDDTEDELG